MSDTRVLTVCIIYDASADLDHVFVLASTNPSFTFPTTAQDLAALEASIVSFDTITSGPFAPGTPIDFNAIFAATLVSTTNNDVWFGKGEPEIFDGGIGNDSLSGEGGDAEIFGGAGEDFLNDGSGDDALNGGAGFDFIVGGPGNDLIDGGDMVDGNAVGYFEFDDNFGGAVNVNLATGIALDSWRGTDTLSNIDGVVGSRFNDTLIGDENVNGLLGSNGSDLINGAGGSDWLVHNFALLGTPPAGVNVNLANARASDSWGNTDTVLNIEDVEGTLLNDTLLGDGGANILDRHSGNDLLDGGEGNDVLRGGSGFDTLTGGAGDDQLIGGANWDVFVFQNNHGADTISDFDALNRLEKIDLSAITGLASFADYTAFAASGAVTAQTGGVTINTGSGTIFLAGVNINDLDNSDFIF